MQNIGLLYNLSLGGVRYKAVPMHFLVRFLEAPIICAPRENPCSHLPAHRQNITRFVDGGNKTRDIMRLIREMDWTIGLTLCSYFNQTSIFSFVSSATLEKWCLPFCMIAKFARTQTEGVCKQGFVFFVVNTVLRIFGQLNSVGLSPS
jgi:hypothetical protein